MIIFMLALLQDAPEKIWTVDTQAPSYGSAAAGDIDGDGKLEIVFGTYFNDEHLYAVNAEDGTILWKVKSDGGPLDASVAIVDLDGDKKPEILTGDSSTGKFFCFDGAGKEKWSIKLLNSTDAPPAVADLDGDGVVEIVVGTMWKRNRMGDVAVYRADNQKLVWSREVKGCVQSEACLVDLDGDKILDVIVGSWRGDSSIHAFSGKDGKDLWTFETSTERDNYGMYHGVSCDGERIAFGTCDTKAGTLYVLDTKGKLLWKDATNEYLFAPTTMVDLDGDRKREIVAIGSTTRAYQADGKLLWKADVGSARGPAIADIDGRVTLVLGTQARSVVALDGSNGKTLWSFDTTCGKHEWEGVDNAPVIADFDGDGRLEAFFVAGKGTSDKSRPENYGRAYALRLGKGTGSWLTFRGNLRRTGCRD